MAYEPIKNTGHAFYVEFFGSVFLGFAIFALTNPKSPVPGSMVPLIIAAAYAAMVASLGGLTGYVRAIVINHLLAMGCGTWKESLTYHTHLLLHLVVGMFGFSTLGKQEPPSILREIWALGWSC